MNPPLWVRTLVLPVKPLDTIELYEEAKCLVRNCSARTGNRGIAWFVDELADAQSFVLEQLAVDPNHLEWQRIHAVLSGARDGLVGDT